MKHYKLILALPFCLLQACSEFYGYQPPAPVYGKRVTNPYESETGRSYSATGVDTPSSEDREVLQQKEQAASLPTSKPAYRAPSMSPAVIALVAESDRSSRSGDLESAVAGLERALRIDPRNPTLTYKLAEIRMKQEKPRLAEDLAKKAALLAAGDSALKRKSWLLISEARKMQQNYHGAKEAKIKAESFVSP
ncbi:tetratricopeptide repeat protein [Methylomarinum sp. Ch1-1]|uniref:Tetratricopeptide repeat protein n=1 Tax=Methylomarinum roseum TaxID=3067653 RepID=A0AAU7NSJ0_9GAMM|nr:tetratricopeptide repeat protein [Methylomarinum sp. Ch1-1]MDP4520443.1 hypothetical protein [Methylomarinum sp. Ch1-1]